MDKAVYKKDYKVYISGKITGLPLADAIGNFQEAEQRLKRAGFKTFNPFNNGLDIDAPYEEHMRADLKALETCDAIYLMDNWTNSKGARAEYEKALELELDILKFS